MLTLIGDLTIILAQGEPAAPGAAGALSDWLPQVMMFAAIGFLFYFLLLRPEKVRRKKHEMMLGELKKNDRIVTIGGILGTVTLVQSDKPHVTIKVDDGNNVKLNILRSAIARVLTDEDNDPSESK